MTNGDNSPYNSNPNIPGQTKQTPLTCTGHTRPVVDLDFSSATDDGFFIVSACKDGKPMLRQGNTGDWVGTFLGHKGAVWCVSSNSNATRACTGSADFSCKIWDCVSGNEMGELPHDHIVRACAFSPDGNKLATGCQDKQVRVFNLENLPSQMFSLDPYIIASGHKSTVKKLCWIDNNTFLTASDDKTVKKWDISEDCGKMIYDRSFDDSVSDVSITNNVVTVVSGKSVYFFENGINSNPTKTYTLPTKLNSASLHQDGKVFVAGGEDLKVYKMNFETGEEMDSYKGHFGPVHIVRFSPDGKLYASGSEDGTIRLWQMVPGEAYGLWKGRQ